MWWSIPVIVIVAVLSLYAAASAYGAARWTRRTRELRERLYSARVPIRQKAVDFSELDDLPAPVRRYFHTVLRDGQPIITGVHVRHEGTFNSSATEEKWRPFTSEQWVVTRRPGFFWNGRIAMAPGLPVRVHDAYIAGGGILHASLLGLVSVMRLQDDGALAVGEFMRYLAETTWYPTALLPGQGLIWEAVDDSSAYGTLSDGSTRATLLFTFNEQNLIESVRAEERGRTVGNETVPTPWQGRFWNYEERMGMLVPLDGEVAWLLPDGAKPYWRGHLTHLDYELQF